MFKHIQVDLSDLTSLIKACIIQKPWPINYLLLGKIKYKS